MSRNDFAIESNAMDVSLPGPAVARRDSLGRDRPGRTANRSIGGLVCLVAAMLLAPGCTTLDCLKGIPSIPAYRVPRALLGRPRSDMLDISMVRLRQTPPPIYKLGPNDVLGIYIENVLGQPDEAPPVFYPEDGTRAPSIGFPIPIREDGTLSLPLVEPISVDGMTLAQATEAIRTAYTRTQRILPEGKDRIIVTLQRPRQFRVMVIREEAGATLVPGLASSKRGTGETLDLPAYENDVLHALNKTGGLPGLDAENEVIIIRGGNLDAAKHDLLVAQIAASRQPCECPPILPDAPNVVRIPLRYYPEAPPTFAEKDIILNDGDIVYIASRDSEKFYTGGAIRGSEHLIPRDYDVDIMQAISMAGGNAGQGQTGVMSIGQQGGAFRGNGGGGGGIGPSRAIIVRKTCNGQTIAIRVDLRKAITDSSERILIQPDDMIIVQYTLAEEITNAALSVFQFNYLLNR